MKMYQRYRTVPYCPDNSIAGGPLWTPATGILVRNLEVELYNPDVQSCCKKGTFVILISVLWSEDN